MAADWIKMETNLHEKPEVICISAKLARSRFDIVGRLHRLWGWYDSHSSDGHAKGVTKLFIDELVAIDGFSDALLEVDWLTDRHGSLSIPRFDRHNGQSAKRRVEATERKRLSRSCHTNVVTETGPEKRREEKSNLLSEGSERTKRFVKPTLQEIEEHAATLNPPFRQSAKFFAHYESNGWKVGKSPMKSWKSAITTWVLNEKPDHREAKAQQEFSNFKHTIPILSK